MFTLWGHVGNVVCITSGLIWSSMDMEVICNLLPYEIGHRAFFIMEYWIFFGLQHNKGGKKNSALQYMCTDMSIFGSNYLVALSVREDSNNNCIPIINEQRMFKARSIVVFYCAFVRILLQLHQINRYFPMDVQQIHACAINNLVNSCSHSVLHYC